MKVLLDQGIARTTESLLRAAGIDATHVGTIGMAHATDSEIIDFASHSKSIIVTRDADFSDFIATRSIRSPSVIRLRAEGIGGAEVAGIVHAVMDAARPALDAGALVSTDGRSIRVRLLPITG